MSKILDYIIMIDLIIEVYKVSNPIIISELIEKELVKYKKENNRDKKVRDIYEKDHNVLFRRMSILSEGKKSDG